MAGEIVELYRKHRPTNFKQVVGQEDAIKALVSLGKSGKIPHALLLTGPSGCGKTTLARILKDKLSCSDNDFVEINASETRGIETIRSIQQRMGTAPLGGKCRIYLMDEAHALTTDAQNAFLKILEDTPSHVYFILSTTDPQNLKKTIITRCMEVRCKELDKKVLKDLVLSVASLESVTLDDEVAARLADVADGSARKALVLLHTVIGLSDTTEQLAAIESNDTRGQAIEIARALLGGKTSWKAMAAILKKVDDDPEGVRRLVLGYCQAVLLSTGNPNAARVMDVFQYNFYDTKRAGLVLACWNVINV